MPRAIIVHGGKCPVSAENRLAREAQSRQRMNRIARLRTLIQLELELLEQCRSLNEPALIQLEGLAQEHIFDLDTQLRTLGSPPIAYHGVMISAHASQRGIGEILTMLEDNYKRAVVLGGDDELTELLLANLADVQRSMAWSSFSVSRDVWRTASTPSSSSSS
jgi:hypothetical protein